MEMMDQRIMENRAECVPFIIGIMSRCLKEDREREREILTNEVFIAFQNYIKLHIVISSNY